MEVSISILQTARFRAWGKGWARAKGVEDGVSLGDEETQGRKNVCVSRRAPEPGTCAANQPARAAVTAAACIYIPNY